MRQRSKRNNEETPRNDNIKDVTEESANSKSLNSPVENSQTSGDLPNSCVKRCITFLKYAVVILVIPPVLNYGVLNGELQFLQSLGVLYDVGFGQRIFMTCNGTGLPTVILDAPTGMSSESWTLVFAELSKITRVCAYDRAGLGMSDRPRQVPQNGSEDQNQEKRDRWQPYTVERMVDDLHRLISYSSQQPRPLILVGAEMGALVARFYAQIYEGDVTDLVLVEPLSEGLFSFDSDIWMHYWSEHLVHTYQQMQFSAAVGLTRLALMIGATDYPMADAADTLPQEVIQKQKHLQCNPRHLSSAVDEHFFINETFSQMQTVFRIKPFPKNVSVTVINGDLYDDRLPSELNEAWAKCQDSLASSLHPNSRRITVNGADRRMLYRQPGAIVSPVKELIRQWRARRPQSS